MESFLSGRKSVSGGVQQPQSSEFKPLTSTQSATPAECGQPSVETIQGPNGIERIIVICECGKRIELVCQYD